MEHSEATGTMASARYLLDEMTIEERNAFEEHYFGCSECARDIREGSAMIDTLRAGRAVKTHQATRTAAVPWLLTAAAAIAIAILGIQNSALRREASPHVIRSYSLLTMGTRGAASVTTIDDRSKPFALYIDIPPQPAYSSYRIEIRDGAGAAQVSLPVTAAEARETITVYVPPNRLQSGKHTVVIVGGESATISSAPLDVR
jgi:hypothetical protein